MPFTFSHAAVVLPFVKNKKLSASALVVGTVAPDLQYFYAMNTNVRISHTFLSAFIVDLPLGLLTLFLFHLFIKKALLQNLPRFFQERTQELLDFDWVKYFKENYFIVFLSIILGAFSHLALDSLTHSDGYFVMNYPAYSRTFLGLRIFIYVHLFISLIGLVGICSYFYKLPVTKKGNCKIKISYWLLNIVITISAFCIKFPFKMPVDINELQILLVILFASGIIALISTGLIYGRSNLLRE